LNVSKSMMPTTRKRLTRKLLKVLSRLRLKLRVNLLKQQVS
jgi:hypothetical protein